MDHNHNYKFDMMFNNFKQANSYSLLCCVGTVQDIPYMEGGIYVSGNYAKNCVNKLFT